jgi:methyltransferase (TIGR00027 family)
MEMKDNSAIHARFARTLALLRAIESYRPEGERLFDDRFSRQFVTGTWRFFLYPGIRQAQVALLEGSAPGFLGDFYCRTAAIDEALLRVLSTGIKQVVILGAGFDARAYRIAGIEQVRVYELDLAEPQRLKQSLVMKAMGDLPAHLSFIPIDFDRQDIESLLTEAGFDRGQKTFFIMEGVTQYITEGAVDRIFRQVSSAAADGSQIVFTYIHRGIIDGTARSYAEQKLLTAVGEMRMPWIFGFEPSGLAEYLRQRGLEMVEEVGAPEFQRRYLKPRGRELNIFKGERVVLAKVAGKAH